jgi:ribosomal protein S18 acetylase RimI-like enzyme
MNTVNKGAYRCTCPKDGERGIKFAYGIRLDDLSDEELKKCIAEIKGLGTNVWWPLSIETQKLVKGADYVPAPPTDGDEFYMFLFPGDKPTYIKSGIPVKRVETPEEFTVFARVANDAFANGYQDIHPRNHFHWIDEGKLTVYIAYHGETPVAVAAIMNNNGIASLEFVTAVESYRRKGCAQAVCVQAVDDAFASGAEIITLRAFHPARLLYEKLGFQICVC